MTENFYFETYTDTGCTFTINSTEDKVELSVYRLPYIIFFPLRYSLFLLTMSASVLFQLDYLLIILFAIPSVLALFTRYTFNLSGRFLHSFHKRFGSKTTLLFFRDPAITPPSQTKNTFSFSLQEVIGLAISGFNKKETGIFYAYSFIHLLFSDDFEFCLGGPFYGRFYTADSAQRRKLEYFHAVLTSVFGLFPSGFPESQNVVKLEFGDGYVSSLKDYAYLAKYVDHTFSPFLSSNRFESSFAKISQKSLDLEFADFNAFVVIGLWMAVLIGLMIPISIIDSLHLSFASDFPLFEGLIIIIEILGIIFAIIFMSIIFIASQDLVRLGRHTILPWFANDQLKYNFVNTYSPVKAPSTPSSTSRALSGSTLDMPLHSSVSDPYNESATENEQSTNRTIFANPRNAFEVLLIIFLIPLYIAISPYYLLKEMKRDPSSGTNFKDSFKGARGSEKIGIIALSLVIIIPFGFIWLMCVYFSILLFWVEVPIALLYYGLRYLY